MALESTSEHGQVPMDSIPEREATIAQIAESEEESVQLQNHLKEIVEGSAFNGSDRCGRFLAYIVNQAIAGHFESLKERVIGVEVFGRAPDYNTSEDAIVRVTASDVRKRLSLHYSKNATLSRVHISLPVGSYIPEITRGPQSKVNVSESRMARQSLSTLSASHSALEDSELISIPAKEPPFVLRAALNGETVLSKTRSVFGLRTLAVTLAVFVVLLAAVNLGMWGAAWRASSNVKAAPVSALPWSVIFSSPGATHLITSDVDIGRMQRLLGSRISVSDYANRNYPSQPNRLTPEEKAYLMQGDKSATLDTQITASIAELAGAASHKIDVEGARNIRFTDLKTDDNFILLGSPFSDPWFSVFNDQLDFQFVPGGNTGLGPESIRNIHPAPNEQSIYAPTSIGGATGASYAIVALIGNSGQYGQVLLLAGVSGEGTQAAGKFVTDLPRLSLALQKCGISSPGPLKHFEILLRVNLMAGSPSEYDVVACHILPETSPR